MVFKDTKKVMVVFGNADPEEQAARKVAEEAGFVTATATVGGKKVGADSAYYADGFVVDSGDIAAVSLAIIFECSAAAVTSSTNINVVALCDHHHLGDPGYGLTPERYWEASSLGQLCTLMGAERTHERELIAVGDHCPAAGYAGLCPGVTSNELFRSRLRNKALFRNKSTIDIVLQIKTATRLLQKAPVRHGVCDLLGAGEIDELPEAALIASVAYVASLPDTNRGGVETGDTKIIFGGRTTPEMVKRFEEWGNSLSNKVAIYADPERGFARVVVNGSVESLPF